MRWRDVQWISWGLGETPRDYYSAGSPSLLMLCTRILPLRSCGVLLQCLLQTLGLCLCLCPMPILYQNLCIWKGFFWFSRNNIHLSMKRSLLYIFYQFYVRTKKKSQEGGRMRRKKGKRKREHLCKILTVNNYTVWVFNMILFFMFKCLISFLLICNYIVSLKCGC